MEKIIKIYDSIRVKSIVYESGDADATIICDMEFGEKIITSKLLVSQTDLNRLIAKLVSNGSEWLENTCEVLYLEDGTQLIEYNLEDQTRNQIQDFQFNYSYAQIGA
ncbi:MAG: hypothetical protein R3279_12390 [Putridiphycobacter sp.]|nr:hypothetical protein [Putridiphycobacter sp.]